MAAQGSLVLASQLTNWYAKLNQSRQKFNLGTIAVPSVQGQKAAATHMNNLNTALDKVVSDTQSIKSSQHYTKSASYAVTVGQLIQGSLSDNIDALLAQWNNVCYYNSNNSDWGDWGDWGDDSDYDMNCSYCYEDNSNNMWEDNYMDFGTQVTSCSDNVNLSPDNDCSLCSPNR